MLFWIKQRLIYFKLQKKETQSGSSKSKNPSTERFQLQMPVLHQIKCISKTGPLSLRQVWAEYKNKVPEVSIEILEHHVIPRSS